MINSIEKGSAMRKILFIILVVISFSQLLRAKNIKVDLFYLMERGEIIYPDLKKKYHNLRYARLQETQAFLARFPQFNLNFGFNFVPKVPYNLGEIDQTKWDEWTPVVFPNFSMQLPLYTFGKISNAEEAAKYNVELKKTEIEETGSYVRYQVKQIFWGYVLVHSITDYILKDTISKYEKIIRDKENQFRAGKITRSTLEQARIDYYDLKRNEAEAHQKKEESTRWLKMIAGAGEQDTVSLNVERMVPVELSVKPLHYYLDLAKRYNHGFKKVHYGYLARKHKYHYDQARLLPNIALVANLRYIYHRFDESEFNTILPDNGDKGWSGYFGFVFTLNLSFWNTVVDYKKNEEQYLGDLERIKLGYKYQELKIKQAYDELIERKKRLRFSEEQFKAAKRWLILSINAYEAGTGKIGDAQRGLITLFRRKKDYYYSIFHFNMAVAKFEQLLGMEIVAYKKMFGIKSRGDSDA